MYRKLALLSVVLLIGLAGCGGPGPGAETTEGVEDGESPAVGEDETPTEEDGLIEETETETDGLIDETETETDGLIEETETPPAMGNETTTTDEDV